MGTELLLGDVINTNAAWLGTQLATTGINCHHQSTVGDNLERICEVLSLAVERSDFVIVCGGLGPTQDDITRDAIARVMGVSLVRDEALLAKIEAKFKSRGFAMSPINKRQADIPQGSYAMSALPGTAAGLVCPFDVDGASKVIYAVPGVPWEMREIVLAGVIADLQARTQQASIIKSRVLRTWGLPESELAQRLDLEFRRLEGSKVLTMAFLASGIKGIGVRITAHGQSEEQAQELLANQEHRIRDVVGDYVFGTGGETMASVVVEALKANNKSLAIAESLTGGLVAAEIVGVPGCSEVFRGALVPYLPEIKRKILNVVEQKVVSEQMALEMARSATEVFGADVGLGLTGAAGPSSHEGSEPGVVCIAVFSSSRRDDLDGNSSATATTVRFPYDRERVRQLSCISALDLLRRVLQSQTPHEARYGTN